MERTESFCRHRDIQTFDGFRCCLACGETVFESTPDLELNPQHAGPVAYKYSPLNYALGQEIRLVILYPGKPEEDIALDIVHANLSDNPAYEAISYAWATQDGDASLSQTVYCRGRTIAVTKPCEAALKSLRRQGRNRYLWVDAISIDQGNIRERNFQVTFMGMIYSNASQVLIYLGPGTERTDRILDYLNGDTEVLTKLKLGELYFTVKEFLDQRWLDRVWVLQEIALAKLAIMIAGEKTTQWTLVSIQKVLDLCIKLRIDPPSALRWLPASDPENDILAVLHKSRNCSSTDPRDKVFAVLGLADRDFQEEFPVDYSLTREEVFAKLAIHLIQERKSLAILRYVTGQILMPDDPMPSWIPSWDVKLKHEPLPSQFNSSQLDMLTSIWFSPTLLFGLETKQEPDEKIVRAILDNFKGKEVIMSTACWRHWLLLWLQEVASQGISLGPKQCEEMARYLTQTSAQGFRHALRTPDITPRCQNLAEWHTASSARMTQGLTWPCLTIRAHHLDTIRKLIGTRSVSQVIYFPEEYPEAFGNYRRCPKCTNHRKARFCKRNHTVSQSMLNRLITEMSRLHAEDKTMFQTEQSIGFSQAKMEVGDTIWALDGAEVPLLLRKVDEHYVLIGECYLFGALSYHLCECCGREVEPWTISTEIIDIW